MPPNKELKLTKPCTIGASQLNSSVRPTIRGSDATDADEIATALDQFMPSREETETVQRLYELLPDGMPQSVRVVEALFGVLERFPDAELGAPGPIVHEIERIAGYEAQLRGSLARQPTAYTVWMCNRILNAATDPQQGAEWMAALEAAATHPRATEAARANARDFLAFQRNGESK